MGLSTGMGGQVAYAAETTYATTVAPTNAIEVTKFDVKEDDKWTDTGGIAGGRVFGLASRRTKQTVAAAGGMDVECPVTGLKTLLTAFAGGCSSVNTGTGGNGYRTDTYTMAGDTLGKSLTFQAGIPQTDGTIKPLTYNGCKITGLELNIGKAEPVKLSLDIDSAGLDLTTPALATATFAAPPVFTWADAKIELGATVGALAQIDGISEATIKLERKMATDRFYVGNSGRKREPVSNNLVELSGSLNADYVGHDLLAARVLSGASFALRITLTSPAMIASSGQPYSLVLLLTAVKVTGDLPTLSGLDIVNGSFALSGLSDGSAQPITITHVTDQASV